MYDYEYIDNCKCIHCGCPWLHNAKILINDDDRASVGARCQYCDEITFIEVSFSTDGGCSVSAVNSTRKIPWTEDGFAEGCRA